MSLTHSSNAYLVCGEMSALIDPGVDSEGVLSKIRSLGVKIDYIINTHEHYDHIAADPKVKEETKAKLCAHEYAAEVIEKGSKETLSCLFGEKIPGVEVDLRLKDSDVIDLGGVRLEVIYTPGHTIGGICLYEPDTKSLFSGDTVFSDGVGRCDFFGGNMSDLAASIEKLVRLKEERGIGRIYPGHGEIGCGEDLERIYNIYFRR